MEHYKTMKKYTRHYQVQMYKKSVKVKFIILLLMLRKYARVSFTDIP